MNELYKVLLKLLFLRKDLMTFIFTDLGLRQPRLEGEEYLSIVDEFMEAVHTRWPKAIVQVLPLLRMSFFFLFNYGSLIHAINLMIGKICQFEDFQMKWAFETLQRYRKRFCMFNDDIQVSTAYLLQYASAFTWSI
jgi:hypothetical protein